MGTNSNVKKIVGGSRRYLFAEVSPPGSPPGPGTTPPAAGPVSLSDVKSAADDLVSACKTAPPRTLASVLAGLNRLTSSLSDTNESADPGTVAATARKLGLSAREIEKCRARGVDPKKYAATKAASITGGK